MRKTLSLYYAAIAGLSIYFACTNNWPVSAIAGLAAASYGSLALVALKTGGRGLSTPIRLGRLPQSLLIAVAIIAPGAYWSQIKSEPEAIDLSKITKLGTVMNSIQLEYAVALVHKSDPDFKLTPVETAVPINPIATIVKDGEYERVQEALQNQPPFEEMASKKGARVITYGELVKEVQRAPGWQPRVLWFDPGPTRDTNRIVVDNLTN